MTADANTRKAQERARKRALGLVKLEIWAKPEHHAQIRQYAERLGKRQK